MVRSQWCEVNGAKSMVRSQWCEVNGWGLEELAVQPDHVHLLVQVQPRYSVAQMMKTLKGGTSRVLRAEFPDLEEHLYAPEGITSYGAAASGRRATLRRRWAW